jgi:hypothetical protein
MIAAARNLACITVAVSSCFALMGLLPDLCTLERWGCNLLGWLESLPCMGTK